MNKAFRFSVIFFLLSMVSVAQGDKYALIIAIGDYPEESGWDDLSSANDIPLIKNILELHGFQEEHVWVLSDADATRTGIVESLEHLAEQIGPGDVLYIHYSGHGQQIIDLNDEEMDGYDESLVPYDAKKRYKTGVYEGENHIRDEDFGLMLQGLQNILGAEGSLLVTLDACHSGTATRGPKTSKFRGSGEPCAPEGYKPKHKTNGSKGGGGMFEYKGGKPQGMAPMVVISGARHDQLNSEAFDKDGNACGSLSYSLCKSAVRLGTGSSYQEWFDRIKLEMAIVAPSQDPQIEGDIYANVFGGEPIEQEQYYLIDQVRDNRFAVARMGKMAAVYPGSIVGLYPIGTSSRTDSEALAKGKVIESSELFSEIDFEEVVDLEVLQSSWIFIEEQNFGGVEVSMELDLEDKQLEKAMRKSLEEHVSIDVVKNKGELVVSDALSEGLSVYTKTDAPLLDTTSNDPQTLVEVVTDRVAQYARAKYLREINFYNNDLDLVIEIIPVEYEKRDGKYVVTEELELTPYISDGNQIEFPINTTFVIRVTNKGRKRAYFNLIHISPDDEVDVYIPFKRQSAAECVLNPRQSITFEKILLISDPPGIDVFKVVATDAPLDLRAVDSKEKSTRAGGNPFEELYLGAMKEDRNTRAVPTSTFNTYSLVVKVVEE
jgi:hypothetical protein